MNSTGDSTMERIHIAQHTSLGAPWFSGWLFSIGYLKLDFWMGLLGLIVWPFFLGSHFASMAVAG
jgi:hypothetical protein